MYIIYGIPNCDTVRKTLNWFQKHKIAYDFYNYKTNGVSPEKLKQWSKQVGWESLLNKKGTTWKQLDKKIQVVVITEKTAIQWLIENTSAIKRPLIEKADKVITLGFDEEVYKKIFTTSKKTKWQINVEEISR